MFEYDIVYPKTVTPQEEVVASGLGFAALRGAGDVIAWGRHPERHLLLVVTPRRKEYGYLVILVSTRVEGFMQGLFWVKEGLW